MARAKAHSGKSNLTHFFNICLLVSLLSNVAYSRILEGLGNSPSPGDSGFNKYFLVDDSQVYPNPNRFEDPWSSIERAILKGKKLDVNLLQWVRHNEALALPNEKYDRIKQFGSWVRPAGGCQNTRAKVLIRDSKSPVRFKDPNQCSVETGDWDDPYTGQRIGDSHEVQIDHFVPLKNAYQNGAWSWTNKKRCHYGNYINNDIHLLSVSGVENQKKSDKGPEGYIPPNQNFSCDYLQRWLKVKLIWNLALTPPEATAINRLLKQSHCTQNDFDWSATEVRRQRKLVTKTITECEVF